jgi:hypothetical protein
MLLSVEWVLAVQRHPDWEISRIIGHSRAGERGTSRVLKTSRVIPGRPIRAGPGTHEHRPRY